MDNEDEMIAVLLPRWIVKAAADRLRLTRYPRDVFELACQQSLVKDETNELSNA